jgi:hypothetical protein
VAICINLVKILSAWLFRNVDMSLSDIEVKGRKVEKII